MRETEYREAGDDRVSMWSVPRKFRRVYFPLFYFLGIIGIGWSVWHEFSRLGNEGSYHDIANGVIMRVPAILLSAAFISLVITEGTMVLAEMVGDYLRKRNERIAVAARAKGRAEGRDEGRDEGRAEGAAQMNQRWTEWNRKRLEAKERGEDFDEPPPSSRSANGRKGDEASE